MRGRVVGHAVRAVHGDAADEVLRPVDLAEVALPPALRALAVDLVQAVGRERHALLTISPGVFWSSSSYGWPLPVEVLKIHCVRPSTTKNSSWRALSTSTSVPASAVAVGLLGQAGQGRRGVAVDLAARPAGRGTSGTPSRPGGWSGRTSPSAPVEPEAEVEQALLDARRLAPPLRTRRRRAARRAAAIGSIARRQRRRRRAVAGGSVVGASVVGGRRRGGRRGASAVAWRRSSAAVVAGAVVGGRRQRRSGRRCPSVGGGGRLGRSVGAAATSPASAEQRRERRSDHQQPGECGSRGRATSRPPSGRGYQRPPAAGGTGTRLHARARRTAARTRSSGRA